MIDYAPKVISVSASGCGSSDNVVVRVKVVVYQESYVVVEEVKEPVVFIVQFVSSPGPPEVNINNLNKGTSVPSWYRGSSIGGELC